ncbi:MAG: arginase family protein [Desulfobacterales bacterium]|nr:arginase family protein [Desulfobacterales bacterium]
MSYEYDGNEDMYLREWWGIATMFRCPHDPDPCNSDIALVGVPHSSGNGLTERDQHLGPRALRDVAAGYRRTHRKFKLTPWDICRINDLGDVPLPHAMVNDKTIKDIEAYYKRLDEAGARPVSVGGDHSITLPILRAIAGTNSGISKGPVAVVHFDSHTDGYRNEGHFLGNVEWAGAWSRIMNEEGLVIPKKVFQIGIRGHWEPFEDDDESIRAGYRIIEMDEFDEIGVKAVVEELQEKIGDSPVYITFDLDVLDPSIAPGVSNIEQGFTGMTMREATGVLQGMRGMNVVGADMVCMMPTKDNPSKITAMNAMVIVFEQICLIADYLNSRK